MLQELTAHIGETNGQRLMERLSKQLTENNLNENQKAAVIEQLSGFTDYFGKEEQILDRLEHLLAQTSHNSVIQKADELFDQTEEAGTFDQDRVEEIRDRHLDQ